MSTQTAIAQRAEPPAVVSDQAAAGTPSTSMLALAIERGMSPEVIGKLIDHQERIDSIRARKAFDDALAAAKAEIPVIRKNRHVGYESKKAGASRTDYRHEDMAEIARTIDPILTKYGLSYRFRTQAKPNEPVTVTCIIAHRDGHAEENSLSAGRDDTGNKNSIQQVGSTITYLQRYTLKAALGLAVSADDDARSAEATTPATITDDQQARLQSLITAAGIDEAKVLGAYGIEWLHELPADDFAGAVKRLDDLIAKKEAARKE